MRFTRSHIPVRLRGEYPLALVQPVHRQAYANELLDRMEVAADPSLLTAEHWDAYYNTIVEPNSRPDRPFGAYATTTRKKRHRCAHAAAAASA